MSQQEFHPVDVYCRHNPPKTVENVEEMRKMLVQNMLLVLVFKVKSYS